MGIYIYYKDGIPGRFTDASIKLCDPAKYGWHKEETVGVAIPEKITNFLENKKSDVPVNAIEIKMDNAKPKPKPKPKSKSGRKSKKQKNDNTK
ncbi:MAG: hypothetical protein WC341_07780 [Bacteroidales bacterium]|jgi:hypothetical protein